LRLRLASATVIDVIPEGHPSPVAGWPRRLWNAWKRAAKQIGDVQARVLLTAFYFVVLAPFALLVQVASDPLALRGKSPRGWHRRGAPVGEPLERARRQF